MQQNDDNANDENDTSTDLLKPDVLLEFGGMKHAGNRKYWDYLLTKIPLYAKCEDDKEEQYKIAQDIVDFVEQEQGGRFLQSSGTNKFKYKYVLTPKETVLFKVRRALKEKYERDQKKAPLSSVALLGIVKDNIIKEPRLRRQRTSLQPPSSQQQHDDDDDDGSDSDKSSDKDGESDDEQTYTANDVLLGRYKSKHTGNKYYWDYLLKQLPKLEKICDDKDAQLELAQDIIDHIKNTHGGRFFERGRNGWVLAEEEAALQKVKKALKQKFDRSYKDGTLFRMKKEQKPQKPQAQEAENPGGEKYTNKDVLIGLRTKHKGNVVYWDFLQQQLEPFTKVEEDPEGQFELAQRIIDFVEEKGGRFMEHENDKWVVAPQSTVLQKVRRALKEKYERSYKPNMQNRTPIEEDEEEEEETRRRRTRGTRTRGTRRGIRRRNAI